ncbi:MAG: hypothetical protein M1380_07640 [Chloroflexi bacterium]|nr:hypothetical protein [Chloroflexota bacterium]
MPLTGTVMDDNGAFCSTADDGFDSVGRGPVPLRPAGDGGSGGRAERPALHGFRISRLPPAIL